MSGVPERRGARAVAAVVQFEPDGGGDRRVPLGDLRGGVCDLLAGVRGLAGDHGVLPLVWGEVLQSYGENVRGCDLKGDRS